MEPEDSLPCSQQPATCPYIELGQFSPRPPHPTSWRPILISSSRLRLGLPTGLFPPPPSLHVSPPKLCMQLSCTSYMPHVRQSQTPFLITRIIFREKYKLRSPSLYNIFQLQWCIKYARRPNTNGHFTQMTCRFTFCQNHYLNSHALLQCLLRFSNNNSDLKSHRLLHVRAVL
jgi:hypothetical protein